MLQDEDDKRSTPTFFNLLEPDDQNKYWEMQKTIANSEKRYKRNKRIESLQEALDMIHDFCIRSDPDDWKRCLVCGVCWMGQDIAINTRQLRLLVDKCKSSINGALSKMGYGTAPIKSVITAALLTYIPFLKGNFVEQRQWTVRRKIQFSPMPIRNGLPSPYVIYTPNFVSPEPQPIYMSSSVSTSPETPKEMEYKEVFGLNPVSHANMHQNNNPSNFNNLNGLNNNNNNASPDGNGQKVHISRAVAANAIQSINNLNVNNLTMNSMNMSMNNNSNNNDNDNIHFNNNDSENMSINMNMNSMNQNSNLMNQNGNMNFNFVNFGQNNMQNDPKLANSNSNPDQNQSQTSTEEDAEQFDDAQYNFLYDPCCCCPIQWTAPEETAEDYFMMG
ncbi:hypothetical protein TRFO_10132 [Tritrichomonas foetus]|uniref:Initiator binding domain-containing protein n=1 Tax=Tritrichomonas foetus TaxID=1144522 RepID=A0A1J4JG71_9EUKA|nr:hypothetical protein TRFO_10132 [Tritrichomonas foetus]|eukprot:OHS96196.1 hypothetical protein TRFO_10132 [Tritrichomonas foetus]